MSTNELKTFKDLPYFPKLILLEDYNAAIRDLVFINMDLLIKGNGLRLRDQDRVILIFPYIPTKDLQNKEISCSGIEDPGGNVKELRIPTEKDSLVAGGNANSAPDKENPPVSKPEISKTPDMIPPQENPEVPLFEFQTWNILSDSPVMENTKLVDSFTVENYLRSKIEEDILVALTRPQITLKLGKE